MNLKIIAAMAGVLVASACSTMPSLSAVSRPECAARSYTIYYSYHGRRFARLRRADHQQHRNQVAACEKSGGKLTHVTIIGFLPNKTDNSAGGDKTAYERGRAVFDALVAAGLAAKQIKLAN